MNIHGHAFVGACVFLSLGSVPGSGIAGCYDNRVFNLWGTTRLFSKVAASFYIPTSITGGFDFSAPSPVLLLSSFLIIANLVYV